MITEDDLSYYYSVVETLWLGGANPTLKRIRNGIRPVERDSSHLAEGLAELVAAGGSRWSRSPSVPGVPRRSTRHGTSPFGITIPTPNRTGLPHHSSTGVTARTIGWRCWR